MMRSSSVWLGTAVGVVALHLAAAGAAAQGPPPSAPVLSFAFELRAIVGAPVDVGQTPRGRRRIVPILGGTVEGPGFKGRVVPGGADWQLIQADGFSELDTRYTIETDKGQLIYVQNGGIRHAAPEVMQKLNAGERVDPALVYFRTVPKFETSAPELQSLTRTVFVGIGERLPTEVLVRFYRVE